MIRQILPSWRTVEVSANTPVTSRLESDELELLEVRVGRRERRGRW